MGKRKSQGSSADEELFEVNRIKARKLENGHPVYQIAWKGYADEKHDTWEPLSNLAGIEQDVAAFEAKQRKEMLDFAENLRARKKKQADTNKALDNEEADSSARTTWASLLHPANAGGADSKSLLKGTISISKSKSATGLEGKKKAAIWMRYKPDVSTNAKPKHYVCQELVGQGEKAKICGTVLNASTGPTSLWNHHAGKHKNAYQELKGYLNVEVSDPGVSIGDSFQRTLKAAAFSDARKAECDLACARWLVKSARPVSLPETDEPFRNMISILTRDAWKPPNRRNVADNILKLSTSGQVRVQVWFSNMVMDGVKPSMAGDIWSHKGCSLMGICMYGINSNWVLDEWLVAATPFGTTRHTGKAIDDVTVEALQRQGIKWREGGTVYEALHGKVSDNASNMVKGWTGFDGGFCADHTIELSVKCFTGANGVKQTFARAKGIVAYFHRSTAGIQDLGVIQKQLGLPIKKPVQDVATRWFSSYMMAEWFLEQREAVQMYDVKFGSEAAKNDAYKDNRLTHADWTILEQSMAVLAPCAQATKHLEGTNYVTISIVLPYLYRLIDGTADGPLRLPHKETGQQWLRVGQIDHQVRHARQLLHEDFKRRWIDELPIAQRETLDMCTLLDPRFKGYNFPGLAPGTNLDFEREHAISLLRRVWGNEWKTHSAAPAAGTSSAPREKPSKKLTPAAGRQAASSFFSTPLVPDEPLDEPDDGDVATTDELERYFMLHAEKNMDLDVLAWWKARDHSNLADPASGTPAGLPTLAKMARQYLGCPASSAGVERMFSRAGKMHDDLKAAQSDSTLEHSLLAAANAL